MNIQQPQSSALQGDQITVARMLTLRAALKLEIYGMGRSIGRSAYVLIKEELGLKGNKREVYDQLSNILFQKNQLELPLEDTNENRNA